MPEFSASAIASEVLDAFSAGRQVAPLSERVPGFDLPAAYAVTAELRRLRQARGEKHVGRKIGFSNRIMWAEYGVSAPIWGDMYASTVHDLPSADATFSLKGLLEPRVEPEIAFGLKSAPRPGMDVAALMGCIEWVSHGYEIVDSLFPGWRFAAVDVIAGAGVHAALLLGPQQRIEPKDVADWLERLSRFEIELFRDGALLERGKAANVLDGPVFALRHLVELLAHETSNPPLAAGEIVTTGSVTRAFPMAAGECWTTQVHGLPLPGLDVRFT